MGALSRAALVLCVVTGLVCCAAGHDHDDHSLRRMNADADLPEDEWSPKDEQWFQDMERELADIVSATNGHGVFEPIDPHGTIEDTYLFGEGHRQCAELASCQSHLFPAARQLAQERVSSESHEDAAKAVCSGCLKFLCCTPETSYTFTNSFIFTSYASDADKACPGHCREVLRDIHLLDSESEKEGQPSTVAYAYQYLRWVSSPILRNLKQEGRFAKLRELPAALRVGQNVRMAEEIRGIPSAEFKLMYSGNSVVRSVEVNGQMYVVKTLSVTDSGEVAAISREVGANELLRVTENPHITRYYGFYYTFDEEDYGCSYVNLVFEMCPYTLEKLYDERKQELQDNPELIRDIMAQIVVGLRVLAFNRVAHRDLKLENIFLGAAPPADRALEVGDIIVKIADFDRATYYEKTDGDDQSPLDRYRARYGRSLMDPLQAAREYPRELTTLPYMPPEAIAAYEASVQDPAEFGEWFSQWREGAIDANRMEAVVRTSRWEPPMGIINPSKAHLDLAAKALDLPPYELAKFDVWMLGVLMVELMTGNRGWMVDTFIAMEKEKVVKAAMGRRSGGTICRPSSADVDDMAVCLLASHVALMWGTFPYDEVFAQQGPASPPAGLLDLFSKVFKLDPGSRGDIKKISKTSYLADAVRAVEAAAASFPRTPAEFGMDVDEMDGPTGSPDVGPTSVAASGGGSWRECSLLSYRASPSSSSGGSPSSPVRTSSPSRGSILSEGARSVYSAGYYYAGSDESAETLFPALNSETPRPLPPGEISNIRNRAAGRPEVPEGVVESIPLTIEEASLGDVRVREVRHLTSDEARNHFKQAASPMRDTKEFGYLVVDIAVQVRGSARLGVRIEAYDSSRQVAATPEGYWVNTCTLGEEAESGSWLTAFAFDGKGGHPPAQCGSEDARGADGWVVVPVVVTPGAETVGRWSIHVRVRSAGSPGEDCFETMVPPPLNILDLRWSTPRAVDILHGDDSFNACASCMRTWAEALHREVFDLPDTSAFAQTPDNICRFVVERRSCKTAQNEISDILTSVPREERAQLLSLGPNAGCSMLTGGLCERFGRLQTRAAQKPARSRRSSARQPPSMCLASSARETGRLEAEEPLPMCPAKSSVKGVEKFANVSPAVYPASMYNPWHKDMSCRLCTMIAQRSKEDRPLCQQLLNSLVAMGEDTLSRFTSIWPPHAPLYDPSLVEQMALPNESEDPDGARVVGMAGKEAWMAGANTCAMPWKEREYQMCLSLQESYNHAFSKADEMTPAQQCQHLECCTEE